MPRYFFHILDIADEVGTVLPNTALARKEGLALMAGLIRDASIQHSPETDWHLRITDDDGLTLFHMDVAVVAAAALRAAAS